MSPVFDALPEQSLAELYEILSRYEPKILGIIRSGRDLTPAERERVDDAIMEEAVAVMTPDFEETPAHLRLRELLSTTRALVPRPSAEALGRSAWRKGDPLTGDPYGDGGAANGYGPHPTGTDPA